MAKWMLDLKLEILQNLYICRNSSLNDMTSSRFESMMKQNFQTSELKKLGYDVNKVQKVYQSAIASETQVLGKDGKVIILYLCFDFTFIYDDFNFTKFQT